MNESWKVSRWSRGFQIVQSTFLAQPGHPVFLDVLGRIMKDVQNGRTIDREEIVGTRVEGPAGEKQTISDERLLNILDFTGPGVLSDAVFRYLSERWGVYPHDITQATGPVVVGDILIYPLHNFTDWSLPEDDIEGKYTFV